MSDKFYFPYVFVVILMTTVLLSAIANPPVPSNIDGGMDTYVTLLERINLKDQQEVYINTDRILYVSDDEGVFSEVHMEDGRVYYIKNTFENTVKDIEHASSRFISIPVVESKTKGIDNVIYLNAKYIYSIKEWDSEWASNNDRYTFIQSKGGLSFYCLLRIDKLSKELKKVN